MQTPQLQDYEEQKEQSGSDGVQEILPLVRHTYKSQGDQVATHRRREGGLGCLFRAGILDLDGGVGQWLQWKSAGLQNRMLGVRVPPAMPVLNERFGCSMARSSGKSVANKNKASTAGKRAKAAGARATGGRVRTFLREVITELGKVTWPPRSELLQATMVVMVAVAIAAAYIGVWDLVWSGLVNLVRVG